jgi:hypothetical protein
VPQSQHHHASLRDCILPRVPHVWRDGGILRFGMSFPSTTTTRLIAQDMAEKQEVSPEMRMRLDGPHE